MLYPHLPAVGAHAAPELHWTPSENVSGRHGQAVHAIFNHRWDGGTFDGVVGWLRNPDSQASAHVVYAGEVGPDAGKAAQLVKWAEKAWTECHLNPLGISIETADAVWLGHDPTGFARLARMTALLLHLHQLPARWVRGEALLAGGRGHTRHADGGTLGCGHFSCPTTDLDLFRQFHERVVAEVRHGGFRKEWGH